MIETDDTIYVFEFKLEGTAEEALKQIDDKGYAIQYEAGDKKNVKVGENLRTTNGRLSDGGRQNRAARVFSDKYASVIAYFHQIP